MSGPGLSLILWLTPTGPMIARSRIGFTRSFGSIGFPLFVDGVMFLFMALVLIFKPSGLFGRPHR